jgi:peptidoglycan/xylan/chitin deacetylase (PgdA/CDA1 family)
MIRSIGKTCFAYAYKLASARGFVLRQSRAITPFIVCYHRVVDNFERTAPETIPSMLISTRMLELQLDWLSKRFLMLSLDEIGAQLESGQPFAKPAAAITFDDGYSDVYQHAYPLLQRKGIPAAFFVVTGLVDSGRPQVFDRLYLLLKVIQRQQLSVRLAVLRALKATGADASSLAQCNVSTDDPFTVMTAVLNGFPQQQIETAIAVLEESVSLDRPTLTEMIPLNWEMVETMHRRGMTIGAHTHSHLLLTAESISTAEKELVESKQILETRLKTSIRHFAYPDGRYNPAVVDAVSRAGYRFGYGVCHARDKKWPLLTIPRKVLWERACLNAFGKFSSAVMNCQVNWAFDTKKGCDHDHSQTDEVITDGAIC